MDVKTIDGGSGSQSLTASERPRHRASLLSSRRRVTLTVALVVGLLVATVGATLASFSAETKNPTNDIATGTLVLSDTKTGGSTCLSTGGGNTDSNVNSSCDSLFSLGTKMPGDTGSATLTIKNEGSLAASAFKLFTSACADMDASLESYHGTGSLCGITQFDIQQYSDSGFTTPSTCIYGGGTATTCDWSDASKTLDAFTTAHTGSGNAVTIGSGLAAGGSAYFKISFKILSTADNTVQGVQAAADLTWHIDQ